jgi:hypothetical protein
MNPVRSAGRDEEFNGIRRLTNRQTPDFLPQSTRTIAACVEELRMGPESFRSHADECTRLAQKADDPEYRSLLLSMAQTWVVLADSAEKVQTLLEQRQSMRLQ